MNNKSSLCVSSFSTYPGLGAAFVGLCRLCRRPCGDTDNFMAFEIKERDFRFLQRRDGEDMEAKPRLIDVMPSLL